MYIHRNKCTRGTEYKIATPGSLRYIKKKNRILDAIANRAGLSSLRPVYNCKKTNRAVCVVPSAVLVPAAVLLVCVSTLKRRSLLLYYVRAKRLVHLVFAARLAFFLPLRHVCRFYV